MRLAWSVDPFSDLSKEDKKAYRYILRKSDEKLRAVHPNGPLALRIPPRIRGRLVEPESMTHRKKKLDEYMAPHPSKMKEPKVGTIYRGRGRTLRLQREREDSINRIRI